jgi:hypothetical protein
VTFVAISRRCSPAFQSAGVPAEPAYKTLTAFQAAATALAWVEPAP